MPTQKELQELRKGAVRWAVQQHKSGSAIWENLCQKGTRTSLKAPGGAASAKIAWESLKGTGKRRRYNPEKPPPLGVPVYFKMNTPYWHAAISAGKGYVWSTDILRRGKYDKVSIKYLEKRWNARCLGWTTEINGKRVW